MRGCYPVRQTPTGVKTAGRQLPELSTSDSRPREGNRSHPPRPQTRAHRLAALIRKGPVRGAARLAQAWSTHADP